MNRTINKIKFKLDQSRTAGRELRLIVDDLDLFDHLEAATEKCPYPGQWSDKETAVFDIRSLKKSTIVSGEYPLIGSTAISFMPEDVCLREVQVQHDGDYIYWRLFPPGAGFHYETDRRIEFCFHKPQYTNAIEKLISSAKVLEPGG